MPQWVVNKIIYCLAVLLTFGPVKVPVYRHICKMADSVNVSLWAATCADYEHASPIAAAANNPCQNTPKRSCCTKETLPHCTARTNHNNSKNNTPTHTLDTNDSPCCQTYTEFAAIEGNFLLQFFTPQVAHITWVLLNTPLPKTSGQTAVLFFAHTPNKISFGCNKPPPYKGRNVLSLLQTFRC